MFEEINNDDTLEFYNDYNVTNYLTKKNKLYKNAIFLVDGYNPRGDKSYEFTVTIREKCEKWKDIKMDAKRPI